MSPKLEAMPQAFWGYWSSWSYPLTLPTWASLLAPARAREGVQEGELEPERAFFLPRPYTSSHASSKTKLKHVILCITIPVLLCANRIGVTVWESRWPALFIFQFYPLFCVLILKGILLETYKLLIQIFFRSILIQVDSWLSWTM